MEKNKYALIVGASKGLGLAIVRELLERGWNVVASSNSTFLAITIQRDINLK